MHLRPRLPVNATRARTLRLLVGAAVVLCSAVFAGSAHAYIYWSDYGGFTGGGTTLGRADIDGGAVNTGFITGATNPSALAVEGGELYWSENGTAIARANADGGGVNEAFIAGSATSAGVFAVALDSSHIYWTDGSRYIGRANLDGSGANGHFIDMGPGGDPEGITVFGGTLYVGEPGQIRTVSAAGVLPSSTFLTLTSGSDFATSLTVAAGYVYWTDLNPGVSASIGRVPLSGSGANQNFVPGLKFPEGIAADGTYIYWTDNSTQTIGRARLDGTQVNTSFISDPGGPAGLAVDALVDATATTVSCTPTTVAAGGVSACTAAVGDSASSEVASGAVVFSGAGGTFFPGGNSCTLTAQPGGGASCTVGAEATTTGSQTVSASYQGDPTHAPSSSSGHFCAGGSTACGGGGGSSSTGVSTGVSGGPGGGPLVCRVPRLAGRTLTQARKLLAAAYCRLGRVVSPRRKKGQRLAPLVVRSQSPAPGRTLGVAGKISVRLGPKPKPPHRKRR